jgi:hypothetical protein
MKAMARNKVWKAARLLLLLLIVAAAAVLLGIRVYHLFLGDTPPMPTEF